MTRWLSLLSRDTRASSAAEFALVLPLLIIFLLGILDVGRLMWTWNQAEKATQMGVRFAVATDPVASDMAGYSFVRSGSLGQGDAIPPDAYGTMKCYDDPSSQSIDIKCDSCTPACPWGQTADATAYTRIFDRMRLFMPTLKSKNIEILYKSSGLGYAGDPNGSDASPIVTVELSRLTFQPTLLQLFGGTIPLPSFSAALTMEDGQGTVSN